MILAIWFAYVSSLLAEDRPRPMCVRVSNLLKFGMVCPVDTHMALTAKHVFVRSVGDPTPLTSFWSPLNGETVAVADLVMYDSRRDLALIKSDLPFPVVFQLSQRLPAVGDRVYITTPDWRNAGFRLKTKVFKVTAYIGEHFITDQNADAGASGSCVFNEQDEVVGIHVGWISEPQRGLNLTVAAGRDRIPPEFAVEVGKVSTLATEK